MPGLVLADWCYCCPGGERACCILFREEAQTAEPETATQDNSILAMPVSLPQMVGHCCLA